MAFLFGDFWFIGVVGSHRPSVRRDQRFRGGPTERKTTRRIFVNDKPLRIRHVRTVGPSVKVGPMSEVQMKLSQYLFLISKPVCLVT